MGLLLFVWRESEGMGERKGDMHLCGLFTWSGAQHRTFDASWHRTHLGVSPNANPTDIVIWGAVSFSINKYKRNSANRTKPQLNIHTQPERVWSLALLVLMYYVGSECPMRRGGSMHLFGERRFLAAQSNSQFTKQLNKFLDDGLWLFLSDSFRSSLFIWDEKKSTVLYLLVLGELSELVLASILLFNSFLFGLNKVAFVLILACLLSTSPNSVSGVGVGVALAVSSRLELDSDSPLSCFRNSVPLRLLEFRCVCLVVLVCAVPLPLPTK